MAASIGVEQQKKSLATLISCVGIGQNTLKNIEEHLHSHGCTWAEFWDGGKTLWHELSISEKQIEAIKNFLTEHTIDSYFERLIKQDIRVVVATDMEYPPLLKETDNPPTILFVRGRTMDWQPPVAPIAVVGTRHMTAYGKMVTEKITQELVNSNCAIISGFMYGVDTCAHRTALEHHGNTIGVLGYGFDHCYPSSHREVFQQCLAAGMIFISPFSPEVQPQRGNFPARNSIVAGMSAAVVVTEAALKSGTHITAGIAAELGRPVCAVPGPINSPYAAGTKWLINQGATLVESGREVLAEVSALHLGPAPAQSLCTASQSTIVQILTTAGPSTIDALQAVLPCSHAELLSELTELELQGFIKRYADIWMVSR